MAKGNQASLQTNCEQGKNKINPEGVTLTLTGCGQRKELVMVIRMKITQGCSHTPYIHHRSLYVICPPTHTRRACC